MAHEAEKVTSRNIAYNISPEAHYQCLIKVIKIKQLISYHAVKGALYAWLGGQMMQGQPGSHGLGYE